MRNQAGMAVGNVVGSNIFNIVLVMGTTAMVSPVVLDAAALNVVLPFMVGSGLLMVVQLRTGWDLTRKEGIVMLSCYAAFLACNFYLAIKK
jgi:cation:H+ antiporter